MSKKISKDAKLLISSDLIYILTHIFIDTFLVAYFLQITNDNLAIVSLYYIIIYTLRGFGNIIMGKIVKTFPEKNKEILSFGIILRAMFILFLFLLSENISKFFVIIAVLYSISESFYWCSHELLYIDLTNRNNRKHYMSIKKLLSKVVNLFAPIILGTSIELYSFTKISIWVFILSIIQVILILSIKNNLNINSKEEYSYKKFLNYIRTNDLSIIKKYKLTGIIIGILENSVSTLIIYITLLTFKTTFNLGLLSTIFAIFSIISLLLYKKYYNKKNRSFILLLCCTIYITGLLGLLIEFSKFTLLLYNFAYIVAFCIFDVIYNTLKGNLVKEYNLEKYRVEYVNYTSISVLIGRVLGYLFILLVSFTSNITLLKIILFLFTNTALLFCYLIYKIEKNIK